MRHLIKLIGLGALVLLIGACTSSIRTNVVSFHKLEKPQGETFNIIPKAEGAQAGLEFNSYAKLVGAQLKSLGYKEALGSNADLTVKIDYGVTDGREKVKSSPYMGPYMGSRFYGNWGFGFGVRYGYDPFWPGFHFSRSELYVYTQYTRRLEMDIIDNKSEEILFEGRVISPGKDKRIPEGMPYLVEALFTGFPGESGKTRKVIISKEDR